MNAYNMPEAQMNDDRMIHIMKDLYHSIVIVVSPPDDIPGHSILFEPI